MINSALPEAKKDPELSWLKEVPSQSLQMSLRNLDTAFKIFFRGTGKYPLAKKKGAQDSISFPQGNLLKIQKKTKKGLNRAILRQGWGNSRIMMEYKTSWYGSHLILVSPKNTSRRCCQCGYTHEDNRQTQADFLCLECGHDENADKNAANTIRRLGLESLGHQSLKAPAIAC